MDRRSFLKYTSLCSATALMPGLLEASQKKPTTKRPNIIFLMSDDHAKMALSCYGSKINKTPNMDRLAEEGMRFNHAFCTNSLCAPSRATILTSKYSHKNGFTINIEKQGPARNIEKDKPSGFDGSQQTLPKLMRKGGYQTSIIGKWHLGTEPTGFDYWCVLPDQGRYHNPEFIRMGKKTVMEGYSTDVIMDETLKWIDDCDDNKPFFLMCQFKAAHVPHDYHQRYAHLYNEDLPEPETLEDDYKTRCSAVKKPGIYYRLDNMYSGDLKHTPPKDLKGMELRKWYYQAFFKGYLKIVAGLDDNIGRLLDYLDKKNLTENTLVVYTTDNGFHLGDHGWYNKMWMTEESIHLPLLMRYPREIPSGTVSDQMVTNLDFAPTFLDIAGLDIPEDMQGKSFRSVMQDKFEGQFRKSFYYHYYQQYGVPGLYGVRTSRYKLIYYYTIDEWELFDLKKDPEELINVYPHPDYKDVVKQMKVELKRVREHFDDTDYDFEKVQS